MARQRISVIAKPNSPHSKIEYDSAKGAYLVFVKSKPERGKANAELLNLVRKEFGKNAAIARGLTGRKKIVEIW